MGKRVDITGQTFNRLTAIAVAPNGKHGQSRYLFSCSCGAKKEIDAAPVKGGNIKSCGCLAAEMAAAAKKFYEQYRAQQGAK